MKRMKRQHRSFKFIECAGKKGIIPIIKRTQNGTVEGSSRGRQEKQANAWCTFKIAFGLMCFPEPGVFEPAAYD